MGREQDLGGRIFLMLQTLLDLENQSGALESIRLKAEALMPPSKDGTFIDSYHL